MAHIEGVILDVDGTLVDSNDLHTEAWVQAFRQFGFPTAFDQIKPLIGMGGDKIVPLITGESEQTQLVKSLKSYRSQLFKDYYMPQIKPFPKVRELLLQMIDSGLRLVVGTSANQSELEGILAVASLDDLLHLRTTKSDADNSKPDPDIIEAALQKLGYPADRVIMLGDTPYDIKAAKEAYVRSVALRSGGWDDLSLKDAIAIYEDPADLYEDFLISPFVSKAPQPKSLSKRQKDLTI